MRFANTEAFFLLVLLIPFSILVVYNYNKKRTILGRFVSSTAFGKLGVRSGREIDFFKAALVILAIVFFILALAGPEWGDVFESLDVFTGYLELYERGRSQTEQAGGGEAIDDGVGG